jgi:type I restriction enzyme S subunit
MPQDTHPLLRFPEFVSANGWELVPLRELATRVTERNTNGHRTRVLTNSAEFGVVDQRDYFERDIVTKGNLETYFVVEHGDYVYNPRVSTIAPVGPISKNRLDTGIMSPLYTVFRFHNKDNDFYALYFASTRWHG